MSSTVLYDPVARETELVLVFKRSDMAWGIANMLSEIVNSSWSKVSSDTASSKLNIRRPPSRSKSKESKRGCVVSGTTGETWMLLASPRLPNASITESFSIDRYVSLGELATGDTFSASRSTPTSWALKLIPRASVTDPPDNVTMLGPLD